MPEVAGDTACLVDPFDVTSIREGILKVINDPAYRDELVRRGFENVNRFRAEKIAQEYVDIYRELKFSMTKGPFQTEKNSHANSN